MKGTGSGFKVSAKVLGRGLVASCLYCPHFVFSLLFVIFLNKMQLDKVVFMRIFFYTGIHSVDIQITSIIAISASKKKAIYMF